MNRRTLDRLTPFSGVVFILLVIASFALLGEELSDDASNAQVIAHYADNKDAYMGSAFILHAAIVFLILFGGSLRKALRSGEAREASASTVAFAGAIVAAVGFLIVSMIGFALGDAADAGRDGAVLTLNELNIYTWVPFTGGFAVMLLAAGVGGLRTLALPRILSWAAIVLGVAFLTPVGIVAFFALPLWILAVSIVLYRQGDEGRATAAGLAAPAAGRV